MPPEEQHAGWCEAVKERSQGGTGQRQRYGEPDQARTGLAEELREASAVAEWSVLEIIESP
ncbi:MAG: hypothetical protein AVDCRST_MAG37-2666 [uncultured Rubrobacteraceae bacterium]|uniref:Uncharacterized protein n=1 Tax=uncultured Rubrobacteraceae bacterium TaxID=349277 RepID=A0A6J4QSA4_9ACTN|nr:MAG: hypothetical protein AVDCRST_MAG37-2666 [uncultured Rubrobacteraceae bacterium]